MQSGRRGRGERARACRRSGQTALGQVGSPRVLAVGRRARARVRSARSSMCAAAQENLRQLCVFKLANESGQPWQWWDYVTRFADECKMSEKNYNEECAEKVRQAAGHAAHARSAAVCAVRLSGVRHAQDAARMNMLGHQHSFLVTRCLQSRPVQ